MGPLRAVLRLMLGLLHALAGLFTILLRFRWLGPAQREARVQAWALRMLSLLGIRLELHGTPMASGPVLLVANHISWLDILVMHAARHCRFVSKADVRGWPLIGVLASGAGTIYIERESRRDAMRVVHRIAQSLGEGEVVAIFPEGTTSDGVELLPFHANLLQAAISTGAPVQPVALRFIDRRSRQLSLTPCYVGEDTLLGSIWRTLAGPPIIAVVRYGDPQTADGRDRRAWAAALRRTVDELRRH